MLRIGLVGDLSQNDPGLLTRALDAALANSDVVIQLGDVNPGYTGLRSRLAGGRVHVVPGNHDTQGPGDWSEWLSDLPTNWAFTQSGVGFIGLDNSQDTLPAAGLSLLKSGPATQAGQIFIFAHKGLSPIVLPDGTESTHIMGEGNLPNADAVTIQGYVKSLRATFCCGHYHGTAIVHTGYGPVIVEGRGGAAGPGNLGYTLVCVQPEGWTMHPVTI